MTNANKDMNKPKVWVQIFDESIPYDEPRLRLLMSYLHVLLEQYLSVRELMSDPFWRANSVGGGIQKAQNARSL